MRRREGTLTMDARLAPFASISDDVLRKIVGVVFDVDDTVTRNGRVEAVAFDAMWRMHDAGIALVTVTGRPLGWADLWARQWPVLLAVAENGAGFSYVHEDRFLEGYFDDAETREAFRVAIERVRASVAAEMPHVRVSSDDRARRYDLAFDVHEHDDLDDASIERLRSIIEAHGARCVVSSVHAHALLSAATKATGVARALERVAGVDLEAERDRWLFVGDSGNDADAFAYFPLSIGVSNVREHLHRLPLAPAFVTRGDRGRGFAEVADRLVAVRHGSER